MAKRKKKKSATALFEVMSAGKSLDLPTVRSRPLVQPPGWFTRWRAHRAKVAEARAARAEELAAMTPPVIEAPPPPRVEIKPEPEVVAATIADPEAPSKQPFSFKIDFTTGVIIASGLVCFVGLTLLISNKLANPQRPPMMAATQTQQTTANRGVIDVPRHPDPQPQKQQPSPEDHPATIDPQPDAQTAGKRVINMNYVVIQSYQNEKLANDAADFLKKNGVDCTVVDGLSRWSKWFTVVGTKPFPPRSSSTTAYETYVNQIKDISTKFAGKSRWNRFEPQPYRWGADSEK